MIQLTSGNGTRLFVNTSAIAIAAESNDAEKETYGFMSKLKMVDGAYIEIQESLSVVVNLIEYDQRTNRS